MSEDVQPNEVRLSRKGSSSVPRVRTTRPPYAPRPRPTPGHEFIQFRLPPDCHKGAPGCHGAREKWIHDQKRYLYSNRHLSVISFKYQEHDSSMLFTCRARQASQHAGRDGRGYTRMHLVNARPDKDSIGIGRPLDVCTAPTQASSSRCFESYVLLNSPKSTEPGPSLIRPTPRILAKHKGCPQRPDDRTSVTPSCYSAEKWPAKSSTMDIESYPMQAVHSDPARRGATIHTVPSVEIVIDLTRDSSGLITEGNAARWPTFRSGCLDVCLPLSSNDPAVSSSEASTGPQSSIDQTPTQIRGHNEDPVRGKDTNLLPSVRAHDIVRVVPVEDRQIGKFLSGQPRQHGVPDVAGPSCIHDYSVEPEGQAEVPSPSDRSLLTRSLTSACSNLALLLGPHDKPRRLLHHDHFAYVVTAHGIIDQVDTASALKWGRNIRSPSSPYEEFVDDACILPYEREPVMILCHAREQNQIALLHLDHGQVSRHISLRRDWNTTRKSGASAITPLMSPLKFASGGYDHRVHIWDIAQDLSGASAVELAIKHTSLVHSLLPIVDTSHKLVSVGADRDIHIYDMSAEHVMHTLRTSCVPYHAHKTDSPFCILLEVAHLETQFELRDRRVPNQAVQRFGFITEERRGRYEKAGTWSHFVVCGDKNGTVRLWDLRNVSKEVALYPCFKDPVVQVIKTGPRLLACSKRNELAFVEFRSE